MVTKNDFERVCSIVRGVHNNSDKIYLIGAFESYFSEKNPRFDFKRFEKCVNE